MSTDPMSDEQKQTASKRVVPAWPKGVTIIHMALYRNKTDGRVLQLTTCDCTTNEIELTPPGRWTGTAQALLENFERLEPVAVLGQP